MEVKGKLRVIGMPYYCCLLSESKTVDAEHMKANLLPSKCGGPVATPGALSDFSAKEQWGMTYGADHRVPRAQQVPENEVDFPGMPL